jgi:uncharacterized protein YbjT (DUF2867 family)
LLAASRQAGVKHRVYISIVGVDRIPPTYYKTKLRVERLLPGSGVGYTVLRATQFHDLIATFLAVQRYSPALLALCGVDFRPIDTHDVASRLVELIAELPTESARDIGGPAIFSNTGLGRAYLRWRGSWRPVIALPAPGKIVAWYRPGAHLVPQNRFGTQRFEDYLRRY